MKKIISAVLSICLMSVCLTQTVLATEKKTNEDIDEIYAAVYETAKEGIPDVIESDEGAYSYLVNNIEHVRREDDGTIAIDQLNPGLKEAEEETVRSFVKRVNVLIQLEAISIDSKLQIYFVSDPEDIREPMRRPTASIMGEARNHANELRTVYDCKCQGLFSLVR